MPPSGLRFGWLSPPGGGRRARSPLARSGRGDSAAAQMPPSTASTLQLQRSDRPTTAGTGQTTGSEAGNGAGTGSEAGTVTTTGTEDGAEHGLAT